MGPRATFLRITILLAGIASGLLAGCTGLTSASSPSSSPSASSPSSPGNSPAAASITQYLYTADSGSRTVTGYKINSDGTLSSVAASPFDVGGANIPGTPRLVRATGSTLIVGDPPLWAFSVDGKTGTIQKSDESTPGPIDLAVDSADGLVYEITQDPGFSRGIAAYRVSGGKLQFHNMLATPAVGAKLALDPAGHFLYVAAGSRPGGPAGIQLYSMARNSDGSLGPALVPIKAMCSGATGESVNAMTSVANGGNSEIFATCGGTANLVEFFVFDGNGKLLNSGDVAASGTPQGAVTDDSGHFLFVANAGTNTVDVYAIVASGALSSSPLQQETAGNSPTAVTFDSTGKFMYVANNGSNNVSAFSFNGTALQPAGTFPVGQSPISITVVKP